MEKTQNIKSILPEVLPIISLYVQRRLGKNFIAEQRIASDGITPKIVIRRLNDRIIQEESFKYQPIVNIAIGLIEQKFPDQKIVSKTQYRLNGWEWDIKIIPI